MSLDRSESTSVKENYDPSDPNETQEVEDESILTEFATSSGKLRTFPHFNAHGWAHPWSYQSHNSDPNHQEHSAHSSQQCNRISSASLNPSIDEIDSLAIFQGPTEHEKMEEIFKNFPNWETLLKEENHKAWKRRCEVLFSEGVANSPIISKFTSYKSKLRAFLGSWNSALSHCSPYIYLKEDRVTAHRIPKPMQSDAIRGKLGFNRGLHAWEIKFTGGMGTHCCVGISTKKGTLTYPRYVSLVGYDSNSFGWDLISGKLYHKQTSFGSFPPEDGVNSGIKYEEGETIKMILDCESSSVSFFLEDMFLGTPFTDLPKYTYFPSVSMVYGNAEASLVYLGPPPLF